MPDPDPITPKTHRPRKGMPAVGERPVPAPIVAASAPDDIIDAAAAGPARLDENMEAALSPATDSDTTPATASVAHTDRGTEDMATIASPAEAADKAQAMLGDMQGKMKSAFDKSSKMSEEMVDFAKGNVEALMASARVAAKATETLGQEAADFGKKSFESATAAFKSFATVKSPTELMQLQTEYARTAFDSAVAEASKMSEAMMKFAGEIAQPISNRYALAAEKIKTAV